MKELSPTQAAVRLIAARQNRLEMRERYSEGLATREEVETAERDYAEASGTRVRPLG